MAGAGVAGEVDGAEYRGGGAGVVDGGHRHEGGGVAQIAHHAHLELVLGLPLLDVHAQLQGAHVASELGHGIDAALVEKEAVGSTICVAGGIVDHRLVFVSHRHILVCECPAVGFHTGLGDGGCGV